MTRNEDNVGYSRAVVVHGGAPHPTGERAFTLAIGWLRGYADKPNTYRAYRLDLFGCRHGPPCTDVECKPSPLAWLRWCAGHRQDPVNVRTTNIQWWLADLADADLAEGTRARKLAAVSSFYLYLFREEVIDVNPVARLDPKRRPKSREPGTSGTALADEQALALLAAADRDHPCHAALVATALYCGLRVATLADLNTDDLTNGAIGPMLTYRTKGGKTGRTPLPPPAYDRILAWQAVRDDTDRLPALRNQAGRRRPLFVRRNGRRLNEPYVWRLLRRLAPLAGISDPISPHDLRRTFGTLGIADGAAIRDMQKAMDHTMSSTTEGYDLGAFDPDRHPAHRLARRHAELMKDGSHAA